MHSLPTGTVTFLFTDIEGSTQAEDEPVFLAKVASTSNMRSFLHPEEAWWPTYRLQDAYFLGGPTLVRQLMALASPTRL